MLEPFTWIDAFRGFQFHQQARWVLSHHDIPHKTSTFTPVLGEPWLRFKAGKMLSSQRVTAPLLVTQKDGGLL